MAKIPCVDDFLIVAEMIALMPGRHGLHNRLAIIERVAAARGQGMVPR